MDGLGQAVVERAAEEQRLDELLVEARVRAEPDAAAGDAESASDTEDVESVEDALGDEGDDAEIWTEEEEVEEGPLPCDPPLALSPDVGYATPYGLFLVTPRGGTGASSRGAPMPSSRRSPASSNGPWSNSTPSSS